MIGLLPWAWASVRRRALVNVLLVAVLAVAAALPLASRQFFAARTAALQARLQAAPLVAGRGGGVDVLLDVADLRRRPADLPQAALSALTRGLAVQVLPLHLAHQARGFTVVGSDPDYFKHQNMRLRQGQWPRFVGECVLGAAVAAELGLQVGDQVLSTPHDWLDPSGGVGVRLRVQGVLRRLDPIHDQRIFTDIKTCWALDGLAHGEAGSDGDLQVGYHMHEIPATLPLSAAIVLPREADAAVLLAGRQGAAGEVQIYRSQVVLQEVLVGLIGIEEIIAGVGFAALLLALALAGLILCLHLRQRQSEWQLLQALGIARCRVAALIGIEWTVLAAAAGGLALLLAPLLIELAGAWLRSRLGGG